MMEYVCRPPDFSWRATWQLALRYYGSDAVRSPLHYMRNPGGDIRTLKGSKVVFSGSASKGVFVFCFSGGLGKWWFCCVVLLATTEKKDALTTKQNE